MRTRVDMATLTAPARPSTTAPKRSLLVSTHRPHCVRRAGSPLAALSLKLDWSSFHSRPFLSLVGSRGVLPRRRQRPRPRRLAGRWGNEAHTTPVGTSAERCAACTHMFSVKLRQCDAFNHQGTSSCIVEALQNGIAGVVAVPTALPETQEIAVLERHFADVSHVTDT